MELKDALDVFRRRVGKKVVAYEERSNGFIFITDTSSGPYDTHFYQITPNEIIVTNPILCKLDKDKIKKL